MNKEWTAKVSASCEYKLGVTELESWNSRNLYLYEKYITGTCIMVYIFELKQATKMGLSLLHSPLTATSIRVNKFSCTGLCWLTQTLFQQSNRCATKYILDDYSSEYKQRLLNLQLLPLMYTLDYYDILFFVKSLKQPSNHFSYK